MVTMETKFFLNALQDEAIASAIAAAERQTSAEIRVFVTEKSADNVVREAEKQFLRLGMAKTELRNGVLIYISPKSQTFAVIGDRGIHEKCGPAFWEEIAAGMTPLLKSERFTEAITFGIGKLEKVLAREFPFRAGDRNELPNEIARDDREL